MLAETAARLEKELVDRVLSQGWWLQGVDERLLPVDAEDALGDLDTGKPEPAPLSDHGSRARRGVRR